MNVNINGISIELTRKRVKNINLSVIPPKGDVRVSAPMKVSEAEIFKFVRSKIDWINIQKKKFVNFPVKSEKFLNGENFLFLGNKCDIKRINSTRNEISVVGANAYFFVDEKMKTEQILKVVEKFEKQQLNLKLIELVSKWQRITGLYSTGFQIKKMKTRWGTCNTLTKKMCFSLALCEKNLNSIEYVVLHEITHLKIPNHSVQFKSFLSVFMPDWKERKKQLNYGKKED